MMRVAWFTPWPPQRSGIAGRSAEIVPLLCDAGHGIDVFVDEAAVPVMRVPDAAPPASGRLRVQGAHDFIWRATQRQYDVVVYQLGNSKLHEFIWPYLFRWPGLTVLHDARLHHARGRALLRRRRADEYRTEFAWNHPGMSADLAELAVSGFDGPYYYDWPMTRSVVASSRLVATYSRGSFVELQHAWPDRPFEVLALGEGCRVPPAETDRQAARVWLDLPESSVVFGVFGALTAGKRVAQVLRAFAEIHARMPNTFLLLAGATDRSVDVESLQKALELTSASRLLNGLDDEQFDRAIGAVDVSMNLRWPTAREVSGPWVRALAAGRATVTVDLIHMALIPSLDPRTWQPHAPAAHFAGAARHDPVTVAIDILDEDHSLRLAMRRLAVDAELRAQLGRAGRRYWEAEHGHDRAIRDYERALSRAAALPDPVGERPAHLKPEAFDHASGLVARFGDAAAEAIAMMKS
jgi:glycosyltransferase involved in cell wall biosynthesis